MFSSLVKYLIGIACLILLFFAVSKQVPLLRYFFETEGPKIEIISQIEGFGTVPQELKIKVTDNKSGIELIRIRVDQSRLNKEIFNTHLPLNTKEKEITLLIDSKKQGFRPGNIRVTIEAFDRSLDSNGEKISFDVPVSFDKPGIEILTAQHNLVQGGMELAIYRVQSDKVKASGVRVGDKEFVGFPIQYLDSDFESTKGVYFSFFTIPFNYSDKNAPPVIYARNAVGNEATEGFYYRVQSKKPKNWSYEVSNLKDTRFDQEDISTYLGKISPTVKRYFKENLNRPEGSQMSPQAGDRISVTDSSGREVNIINNQLSFRYPTARSIEPKNEGKIVSLLEGDGYKKIVAIDHGFGLVSVYSNLQEILVAKGQEIELNTSIGSDAILPQIQEGGFEYGLFFQGAPVRAIEWWDKNWVNDHIIKKISDMKKILGVTVPLPELPSEVKLNESSETPPEEPLPVIRSLNDVSNEYKKKLEANENQFNNSSNPSSGEERRIRDF